MRPIQPTVRRELAQSLAIIDPRCGDEYHNMIATRVGAACPSCHLDLAAYVAVMPTDWPES